MRIIYSWLREFIPLELSPEDLSKHLLSIGFEVSGIETLGSSFTGVKVAEILRIDRHPNADKLSLCELSDGSEKVTVVCGAKNIAVGQKVPLARIGARLPEGVLKKARIRGVDSQGMICSAAELGVRGYPSDGILVLPVDSKIGLDASAVLAPADHALEVEILPNRPDCLSHLGLARELSAYFRLPLRRPEARPALTEDDSVPVTIEEISRCRRYAGLAIRNVKAVPSPAWLASRLEAMNTKPRNILVDVTNYVLYETGQPLHAFDIDTLKGPEIRVRFSRAGESFSALDGRSLPLGPGTLVIADRERPVALAGIIGGAGTSVSDKTTNIFLESAFFSPGVIRKASKHLGIRTEASYRFERGTDIEAVIPACRRAADLILQACQGSRASRLSDNLHAGPGPAPIEVTAAKVNSILGTDLSDKNIFSCLKAIQPETKDAGQPWLFTPPSHRKDLETVWDMADEVARFSGYGVISDEPSPVRLMKSRELPAAVTADKLRKRISSLGFCEVYNYDFISKKDLRDCGLDDQLRMNHSPIFLANPISSDWECLRPSLLPGLIKNLRHNLHRGAHSARIFEIGNVYDRLGGEAREQLHCAGLLFGQYPGPLFWKKEQTKPLDFFHLKGVVSSALKNFKQAAHAEPGTPPDAFHPKICLELLCDRSHMGWYGKLHPAAAAAFEMKNPDIWIFEFSLEPLARLEDPDFFASARKLEAVSSFPSAWRDLSIVVDSGTPWEKVLKSSLEASGPELACAELADLYEGKGIPEGMKSLTVRLTFCRKDRTLTDSEIDGAVNKILEKLSSSLGARLRA